jgi:hypothetical protein
MTFSAGHARSEIVVLRRMVSSKDSTRPRAVTRWRMRSRVTAQAIPAARKSMRGRRTKFDQELEHRVIRSASEQPESVWRSEGGMQRCVHVFESRSTTQEAIGIVFDEVLDEIAIAQGHRGKDVMACAALEEQVDGGFVALACRPTDDVRIVQVSAAMNVGPGVQQNANTPGVPAAAAK